MLHMYKCAVIRVSVISTKESYLIVGRGGATYIEELVHYAQRWSLVSDDGSYV